MSNEFKNPWENLEEEIEKRKQEQNIKVNINNNNKNDDNNKNINKLPKKELNFSMRKHFIFCLLIVLFFWLFSGIYKIDANQQGVVLYFGKFYTITTPGLNYMLPAPIGKLYKLSVTNINKEEFGFRSSKNGNRNVDNESLMLTGDENIVDIDYEVQWRIKDARNFLFNLEHPQITIRMATESAMREIIAKRKIDDALASKKSAIGEEVLSLLQEILDSYNSGIEIILVQLLRVDPPVEVISAFRDVQTAKADKERKINEAETYRNDAIPKARGEAESIIKKAEAYKESIISNAEGEVAGFLKVYEEYKKNPSLTKKRIYLETMNNVMNDVDKVIVDEKVGKNILQHLQLNNRE